MELVSNSSVIACFSKSYLLCSRSYILAFVLNLCVHHVHESVSQDFNIFNLGFQNINPLSFLVVDLFEGLALVDNCEFSDTQVNVVLDSEQDELVDEIELNNIPSNFDVKALLQMLDSTTHILQRLRLSVVETGDSTTLKISVVETGCFYNAYG